MPKATAQTIDLDRDAAAIVRHMLIVGLSAYGELERLRNIAEVFHDRLPHEDLTPIDVTGDACTVAKFAEALSILSPYREAHEG